MRLLNTTTDIYFIEDDGIEDIAATRLLIELHFCFYKDGAAMLLLISIGFFIHHVFCLIH